MQLTDRNDVHSRKMSPSIYAALVDSMCQNFWPMLTGSISAGFAALMTAVKTGNVWIWPCAILIVVIGTMRAFQMRKYEKRTATLTPEQAADWEPRYRNGAVIYACALGLWCFITLIGTSDPIAHMLCTTVTIGYTAGGAARNYGRPRIVQWHILGACGPMSLALALNGDIYYVGLAVLLLLFFIALRMINLNLHSIFVRALVAREREAALAYQFDTALNNMPHGLCMFGPDGRLAVVNRRFGEMMGIPAGFNAEGASVSDLIAACIQADSLSSINARDVAAEIDAARAGEITTVDLRKSEGRALSWESLKALACECYDIVKQTHQNSIG
ncbi:MAG: hypothetical protein JWR79_59 [Tardiphaga sp.]|nr:hypothetical protein [Tardiphaga sp.]